MSIKIVASQDYTTNIKSFLTEKPNCKSTISEKSEKIFNQIMNSQNFIFNKDENTIENKKFTKYIKKIVSIRAGRELFKRLLKTDVPFKMVFESGTHSCYNDKEKTITLSNSKSYIVCANLEGEKFLSYMPKFLILAHELIHTLHFFEEGAQAIEEKKTKDILDPELDNLEEQETIIGKDEGNSLCENLFRFHFGYPLRINHRGLFLDGDEKAPFTISECASVGALENLKQGLIDRPFLLNLPQPIRSSKWWKNHVKLDLIKVTKLPEVTPLNISLFKSQVEISSHLFQCGADVNAQDEYWGSALHLAVKEKRLDLIKELVGRGANVIAKDPNGLTPLRLALNIATLKDKDYSHKNSQYQESAIYFLAPLSNLNEIDEQGLSILHHAMEIHSIRGFETLIRCGADINCKDLKGNTPLMYSIYLERDDKLQALLKNDQLDINARNTDGKTAMSLAIQADDGEKVFTLKRKGAEIPLEMEDRASQLIEELLSTLY